MIDNNKNEPPSFWRVMFDGLIEGEIAALRFARGGALVGAVLGVGIGILLFSAFGFLGIGVGFVAGAAVGGIGAWLLYQAA